MTLHTLEDQIRDWKAATNAYAERLRRIKSQIRFLRETMESTTVRGAPVDGEAVIAILKEIERL